MPKPAKHQGKSLNQWNKSLAGSGYCLEVHGRLVKVFNEGGDYLFTRETLADAVTTIEQKIHEEHDPIANDRNRATILAALRYWQRQLDPKRGSDFNTCNDIASEFGEPLHPSEIDVLCENLNSVCAQQHECQNCGLIVGDDDIVPIEEVRDIFERVSPGEPFPSGECRECGALTQLVGDDA